MKKVAIVVGASVDLIGTMVMSIGVIIAAMAIAIAQGQPADSDFVDQWFTEPEFVIALLTIGAFWVFVGAFVAAKMAGRDHVRHAAWVGVVAIILGVVFAVIPTGEPKERWWYDVVAFLITMPAAVAGGYLAKPRAP